jgi:small-conductance mechanosensitive channel
MYDKLMTTVLTWPFAAELLLAAGCGAIAWLGHRWMVRSAGARLEPEPPPTVNAAVLQILSAIALPVVWIGLLSGAGMILRQITAPVGLIGVVVPSLWFLMVYRVSAVVIALWLPKRRTMRFMIHLAVAIGILMLAVRFLGRAQELKALANYPLLELGPAALTVAVILKSVFLFWILFLIAGQVTSFLQERIISKTDIDPSLSFAMTRFLKFFLFSLGVLIVLDTAGVNLSTLTVFGGALGIGLGFGLQNIASNLVSGMILLLDRSIKQGDVITVGDSYGWVVKLGARYIVVRTRDGVEKLIPNANLIASEITNWSHSDRAVRLHVKVCVSYKADPFKVRELLLHTADSHDRVLKYPQPTVLFVNFGENGMDFELRVWINDPQEGIESVRSAMRFEIWKIFNAHGIEIPFPQRDLHIKSEAVSRPQEPRPSEFQESLPPTRESGH